VATESFEVTVKAVTVKAKLIKREDYTEVRRIGTITLEFDGNDARVDALKEMIGFKPILLGLADAQMSLDDALQPAGAVTR
jgi:hypothetical protein